MDENFVRVDKDDLFKILGMVEYFNHITIFYSSLDPNAKGSAKDLLMKEIKGKLLKLLEELKGVDNG